LLYLKLVNRLADAQAMQPGSKLAVAPKLIQFMP
jgi:hypothetical protein